MSDKPRGRPSIGPMRQVSVRIDPALHDEACRRALTESKASMANPTGNKVSVSQVCRRAIRIGLSRIMRTSKRYKPPVSQ